MLIQTTSSLVKIEGLNVTAAKLVDEPFRHCAEAGQLPVNQPKTKACSLIEVDELCSFVTKKIKMLDLDSDGFYFWQSAWLCLWQQIDQDG